MNLGILQIEPGMMRVNQNTFHWFTKALADGREVAFENGVATYSDNYLVAASIKAETGRIYYIRTRRRSK